jgi:large subunit ribosomal protein L30
MAKKKAEVTKKLRIRQIRSGIGGTERQKAILRSLGLRKMNQEVVHPANPAIVGMVRSIPHLLEVQEEK